MSTTITRCGHCHGDFLPKMDVSGEVFDLDSNGTPTCDNCWCATCEIGHAPGADCPAEIAEIDPFDSGDPDAARDLMIDQANGL